MLIIFSIHPSLIIHVICNVVAILRLLKLWKTSQSQETGANSPNSESKEVELSLNEAYQMVNIHSRYQTSQQVNIQQENEPVYEQPIVI